MRRAKSCRFAFANVDHEFSLSSCLSASFRGHGSYLSRSVESLTNGTKRNNDSGQFTNSKGHLFASMERVKEIEPSCTTRLQFASFAGLP